MFIFGYWVKTIPAGCRSGAGTIFWLGGQKFIKTSVQNAEDKRKNS